MLLNGKQILIVSPEPWSHVFVSKHHYAIELAKKGNNVVFLNPPSGRWETVDSKYDNLKVCNYAGFWKGLRFFPKWLRRLNQRMILSKIEAITHHKFDIVWSFDNSVFFDFNAIPDRILKISHIVDQNQDFEMERASKSANFCFGVVQNIVNKHLIYNNNSYLIEHGVSIYSPKEDISLPGNNSFKALYFGNLAMPHLDWGLFAEAINLFPQVDFILLGPNHSKVPGKSNGNVYLVEAVDSERLFSFMKSADLLFLFYTNQYNMEYASPHKLLEYFASGKPILSTYIEGYKHLKHLIHMAQKNRDWLNILDKIVSSKKIDDHNASLRIEYAQLYTYEKQIEKIELILRGNE